MEEQRPENIHGMSAAEAKEYIILHISARKMAEKKLAALRIEQDKWNKRVGVAEGAGRQDLAEAAAKEAAAAGEQIAAIEAEIAEANGQIQAMLRQLPGLAARERSVDPDLLEQELLMMAGYNPGEEEKADADRKFRELEREEALNQSLQALKGKS